MDRKKSSLPAIFRGLTHLIVGDHGSHVNSYPVSCIGEPMSAFITGVLVENEDGATYQGKVYDRFLKLHLANGQDVSIFDPFGPLSSSLPLGERYEMILGALATSVHYGHSTTLDVKTPTWQGVIIEPRWLAPEDQYQLYASELYRLEWVLVSTLIGALLMHPKVFHTPIAPQEEIIWDTIRLDLLAVV